MCVCVSVCVGEKFLLDIIGKEFQRCVMLVIEAARVNHKNPTVVTLASLNIHHNTRYDSIETTERVLYLHENPETLTLNPIP